MSLKIFCPKRVLLLNSRILFTIDRCSFCRFYLRFIETVNAKLPYNKRITIINCSNYHDYGIIDDKRIEMFIKYYGGSYPTLFINGGIIRGANSQEELYAWVMSRLNEDFVTDEDTEKFMFNMQCKFTKKGRKGLQCQ